MPTANDAPLARAAGPEGRQLARALLDWYDQHRRVLPWREQPGPYRTWLSEIMLQQTRVEAVLPRYERFLRRFPTVEALASAELDAVLSEWSGLGYYSRARNLHAAAQAVVQQGGFPRDPAGLRRLPGVGEYVAGAVASIAFGVDTPAVDGNVERVLARVYAWAGPRRGVGPLAAAMLPPGRAGDFNQALMDLGSGVCTPRAPRCGRCPLAPGCAAHQRGEVDRYPVKAPKRPAPAREMIAGALVRRDRVLLVRRPAEGLFGGLYELPGVLLEAGEDPGEALRRVGRARLGLGWEIGPELGEVRHVLTHMRLRLRVHAVELPAVLAADGPGAPDLALSWYTAATWAPLHDPGELGLSTLARRALERVRRPSAQRTLA